MAIDFFIMLNCIGMVFLIYVLVNFWNEGRRFQKSSHPVIRLDEKNLSDRIAVIPGVFPCPKDRYSVIPFTERCRQINFSPEHHTGFAKTIEIPSRAIPVQRVSQGRK